MVKKMKVGVLALQGDFAKHLEALRRIGVEAQEVRQSQDLEVCNGLIIPGGESTVISRLIDFADMRESIIKFAAQKPLFGTCAGLILMAKQVETPPIGSLELLDIEVERNAYGRQVDSFQTFVIIQEDPYHPKVAPAFFIRAPRIKSYGKNVRILGTTSNGEAVFVREGHHLGATFHPELTSDPFIHHYFIEMIHEHLKHVL